MSSLKSSDTNRHVIIEAEKSILHIQNSITQLVDLFDIENANKEILNLKDSILGVEKAIQYVIMSAKILDDARLKLENAKNIARKAAINSFKSTALIDSDVCHSSDLVIGDSVIVNNRYRKYVSQGFVTQLNEDFIWIDDEIFDIEEYIFFKCS